MSEADIIAAIRAVLDQHMNHPHLAGFAPEARLNEDLYLDSVLILQIFLNLELEFGLDVPEELISRQDIAAEESRDQARREALARWRPIVQQLRDGMEHRSQQKREFSTARLREIHEAEAIAAIEQVFRGAADEVIGPAIETLAAMSDPEASLALASK